MPVVLLCHFDGTNGSTTFTDVSPSVHVLTAGTTSVTTSNPKFGTGSLASTGSLLSVGAPNSDFNFGSGQFTVECFGLFTSAPSGAQILVGQFQGASNLGWDFGTNAGSLLFFYSTTGADSPSVGAAFSPTLNTWYHLAVDRDASNVLRVYVNGAVITSSTVSATLFASTLSVAIGNDGNTTRRFPGQIDEIRISKGIAQYGGPFTPPTGPFTSAAATQARAMVLA